MDENTGECHKEKVDELIENNDEILERERSSKLEEEKKQNEVPNLTIQQYYLNGARDIEKLKLFAEKGNHVAEALLGRDHYWGENGAEFDRNKTQNYVKNCFNYIKEEADKGDSVCQHCLGWFYREGVECEKNVERAVNYFMKSAEQNNSEGQRLAGYCYQNGLGVTSNMNKAIELWTKSAEQGNPWGQYYLAVCYEKGEGVQKNSRISFQWYTKAAMNGHGYAQTIIKRSK